MPAVPCQERHTDAPDRPHVKGVRGRTEWGFDFDFLRVSQGGKPIQAGTSKNTDRDRSRDRACHRKTLVYIELEKRRQARHYHDATRGCQTLSTAFSIYQPSIALPVSMRTFGLVR